MYEKIKTVISLTPFLAIALTLTGAAIMSGCESDSETDDPFVERTMIVTAYCPCKECCDWKRTWLGKPIFAAGRKRGGGKVVGITASGAKARRGTIAADPKIPFGTRMYVPGYGEGAVLDRGEAIRGDRIDLYFQSHQRALAWGRQELNVKMWLKTTEQ